MARRTHTGFCRTAEPDTSHLKEIFVHCSKNLTDTDSLTERWNDQGLIDPDREGKRYESENIWENDPDSELKSGNGNSEDGLYTGERKVSESASHSTGGLSI